MQMAPRGGKAKTAMLRPDRCLLCPARALVSRRERLRGFLERRCIVARFVFRYPRPVKGFRRCVRLRPLLHDLAESLLRLSPPSLLEVHLRSAEHQLPQKIIERQKTFRPPLL